MPLDESRIPFLQKYADMELKKYNITYEELEKQIDEDSMLSVKEGKKIKKVLWTTYYTFDSNIEYENWKNEVIEHLKKRNSSTNEYGAINQFLLIDVVIGLSQPYLFNRINEIE